MYYADRGYQQQDPKDKHSATLNFFEMRLGCAVDFANDNTGGVAFVVGLLAFYIYWRQAGIMHRQAETTRAIERAFLAVEPGRVTDVRKKPVARVIIRNTGRLAARKVKWNINSAICSDKMRKDGFDKFRTVITESTNILAPQSRMMRRYECEFSDGAPDLIWKDEGALYVWGIVHYEDGFQRDRWTKFCFRYMHDGKIKTGGDDFAVGDGRQHQYGNGTNEDDEA